MKNSLKIIPVLIFIVGCTSPDQDATSPDAIHKSCLEVFQRKGDPMGMGNAMCDSMKKACEKDLNSKECQKAQRMIKNG